MKIVISLTQKRPKDINFPPLYVTLTLTQSTLHKRITFLHFPISYQQLQLMIHELHQATQKIFLFLFDFYIRFETLNE